MIERVPMQFPDIPDTLPERAVLSINRLHKRYEACVSAASIAPIFLKKGLLTEAEGYVEQAKRRILNAQARSSHTADPGTSAGDD
jgi:hypothetical protein